MSFLFLTLALAAEPAWVQVVSLSPTTLPTDECTTKASIKPPGSEVADTEAPTTASNPAVEQPKMEPVASAELSAPYDVSTLPLEPLRGRDADIAAVREVFMRAAAKKRTTRVAFYGASHVAGEFFTGQVRRLLQERFGDAGHGLVMPGPPWKGYRASDINLCAGGTWYSDHVDRRDGREDGRYGPAGIDVSPADLASFGWVQTTKSNPQGQRVSRFEVAYLREPGAGKLRLIVDGAPPIEVNAAGDTGPAMIVLRVPDGPHRLQVMADGQVRIYGTYLERDEPGVIVDAAGVSGRTASSWLRWDMSLVTPFITRRTPDLMVLAYGTNEANDRSLTPERYATDLRAVLTRMRTATPGAACVLVGPSDRGKLLKKGVYGTWPATEWVARVQREVGPEFGCATWDLQASMGGPGSMLRWHFGASPKLAAGDLIHLSAEGYKEVGTRFVEAITGEAVDSRP